MSVNVQCPLCERPLQVAEKFLERQVRCAFCGHPFTASARPPSPPSPAPIPTSDEEPRYMMQGEAPSHRAATAQTADRSDALTPVLLPKPRPPSAPPSSTHWEEPVLRPAADDAPDDDIARWERRRRRAEETVSAPATALMVSGAFTFVFGILCLIGMLVFIPEASRARRATQRSSALELVGNMAVAGFFGFVAGPLIVLGGWMMKRLRVYQLAFTACVLSLAPCHVCWVLALPIGIWALVVLNKPGLKAMFR